MKKSILMLVAGLASVALVGCGQKSSEAETTKGNEAETTKGSEAEIAVVTDVGQLRDGGFNQGTYEGAKEYAEANKKSFTYYAPANGSEASDADRIEARQLAIKNKAKIIVAPGFLQAAARRTVAKENPDIKFVFVDGWTLTDSTDANGNDNGKALNNVTAISYKEQESGYRAGYAVVKDGYTKLGGTFGGAGSNPACNRYAYGFAQGANDAAKARNKNVERKVSYRYGSSFKATSELKTQRTGWYTSGTEIIFSCGGSMVQSVVAASQEFDDNKKIVGVDVDQHALSENVITSAQKGLAVSVKLALGEYYGNEWDSKLGGKTQNLGAAEDATGLPTNDDAWRFKTFTKAEYNTLFDNIKKGTVTPRSDVAGDCNVESFWSQDIFSNINITLDK